MNTEADQDVVADGPLARSTGVTNPHVMIAAAIERGLPVEQLEKLMELAERWERNRAAEAWADAVKKFQGLMPAVVKGNPVNDRNGKLLYQFATFEDIMSIAQPFLDQCNITVTFTTDQTERLMKTTCHVRVGIHVEHTSVTLALPEIPNANDAQKAGGALSYGQRYSFKAALNIRIKGEDNDARALNGATVSEEQVRILNEMLEAIDRDLKKFLAWIGAEALDRLTAEQFKKACAQCHWPMDAKESTAEWTKAMKAKGRST